MKRKNYLFLVATLFSALILAISFASATTINGLPERFETQTAYYHGFNDGMVVLWGENGQTYISTDGLNFRQHVSNILPQGETPVVGYYHKIGGERVILWYENGEMYIYNQQVGNFIERTGSSNVLPAGKSPVTGYYH